MLSKEQKEKEHKLLSLMQPKYSTKRSKGTELAAAKKQSKEEPNCCPQKHRSCSTNCTKKKLCCCCWKSPRRRRSAAENWAETCWKLHSYLLKTALHRCWKLQLTNAETSNEVMLKTATNKCWKCSLKSASSKYSDLRKNHERNGILPFFLSQDITNTN